MPVTSEIVQLDSDDIEATLAATTLRQSIVLYAGDLQLGRIATTLDGGLATGNSATAKRRSCRTT